MMVGGLWIFRLFTVNFSKNFKPPQHRQRNILQASRVDMVQVNVCPDISGV